MNLGLIGHELGHQPAQPDRLPCEIDAAAVSLVENQVDDGQDRIQPIREEMISRNRERNRGRLDLRLGTREPPLHRLFRDDEGACDLLGRQPAERAQRERDLRLERKRGMAAGEDQLEALVLNHRLVIVHFVLSNLPSVEPAGLVGQCALPADPVDRTVASRHDQPATWIRRDPVARPPFRGSRERLLGGVLGEVKVAKEADQRSQHPAPLLTEYLLDQLYSSTTGRSSIAPPIRAAGIRAASPSA